MQINELTPPSLSATLSAEKHTRAPSISPWFTTTRSEWEASVQAWLADVAATHDWGEIRGVTTVKERPWSLVRQVDFAHHTTFFKACSAGGTFEPQLLLFLQAQSVPFLPEIIAVDLERNWYLMADAGRPLRSLPAGPEKFEQWGKALADYALMQIASLDWIEPLLALGLPDRRVTRLPRLLAELLADDVIGVGRSADDVKTLRHDASALLPKFEAVCAALGESLAAAALDHGDFHETNLLLRDGDYRLIDWGDACITHPFCTFSVTWEALQRESSQGEATHWRTYLRDAYLAPWSERYPQADLLLDFERSVWVGNVCRALDCAYMFTGAGEETLNQWRPYIFDQLVTWVESWNEDFVNSVMPEKL